MLAWQLADNLFDYTAAAICRSALLSAPAWRRRFPCRSPASSGRCRRRCPAICVKNMIGMLEIRAEIAVHPALVGVHVQLAHRAHAEDHVGLVVGRALQQAANQLERLRLADLRHVAAAAMGLDRIVDHLGPQPREQLVHLHRIFGAVAAVDRADHLAAVVRRDAQARSAAGPPCRGWPSRRCRRTITSSMCRTVTRPGL